PRGAARPPRGAAHASEGNDLGKLGALPERGRTLRRRNLPMPPHVGYARPMRQPLGALRAAIFALPCAFACGQLSACSDAKDEPATTAAEPSAGQATAEPATGAEASAGEGEVEAAAEAGEATASTGVGEAGEAGEAEAGAEGPPPAPDDYGYFKMPKE